MKKMWYESKTVWFNIVLTVLGVVPIVGAFMKLLYPDAAMVIEGVLAMVAGIGNLILRVWFTEAPLSLRK